MTCDRYHLLFLGARNILVVLSFGLLSGPQPILFCICMHSIVLTLSCNLFRIIILVSTITRLLSDCNGETRLRYGMASRYYVS